MPRFSFYPVTTERLFRRALLLLWSFAIVGLLAHPLDARTPHRATSIEHFVKVEHFAKIEAENNRTIDELIQQRIQKEWDSFGAKAVQPELVKTEANYIRVSATSKDVLYEASFHMQPHYWTHSPTGPDTLHRINAEQPVMYYVGSARTPLALPIVSNLSKALTGDEASYTVNLGVLPLPYPGHPDSIRYYVVIERAIESNHTDNVIRFEQFAKEFVTKSDEPVPLRLASEPLAKGVYILRLENGTVIDFYDDFARFLEEHILINSERLAFQLGKETISDISSRLSIPYSVARTCQVKVELLSVVDTAHALPIVDTIRQPADYLAELDMSNFADGPYRYRLVATDLVSDKTLYDTTIGFRKAAPVIVSGSRIARGDTLEVGGKQKDWAGLVKELNEQLTTEKVVNDRINSTLGQSEDEKHRLEAIVDANKRNTIADIHGRAGIGLGTSAGDNFFVGIEASKPALSFDVSFGFLYASVPYLSGYAPPQNFSQFTSAPKSLGFQLTWIYMKVAGGLIEPLAGIGYYGIWSQPASNISSSAAPLSSATLLSAQLGLASEPLGEMNGLGLSLAIGATTGLGLTQPMKLDVSFKAYVRF